MMAEFSMFKLVFSSSATVYGDPASLSSAKIFRLK
jgi:UDP-glucose 4-epimerase